MNNDIPSSKDYARAALDQLEHFINEFAKIYDQTKGNPNLKQFSKSYLKIINDAKANKKILEDVLQGDKGAK